MGALSTFFVILGLAKAKGLGWGGALSYAVGGQIVYFVVSAIVLGVLLVLAPPGSPEERAMGDGAAFGVVVSTMLVTVLIMNRLMPSPLAESRLQPESPPTGSGDET